LVKTRHALGQRSGARSLLSGADRAYRAGTAPGRCGTPTGGPWPINLDTKKNDHE